MRKFELFFDSKSVFVPEIRIPMYSADLTFPAHTLADVVFTEERNILKNTPSPDNELDSTWLTARLWHYNFLDFDYRAVRELKDFIKKNYIHYMDMLGNKVGVTYIQCWANILRNDGRPIVPHHHADGHSKTCPDQRHSHLSGNLCVETANTSTYFRNPFLDKDCIGIPNKNGEMILFPSYVVHWTDPNPMDSPRVTISFDIITEEFYNMIDGENYRRLT